jgi:glycosyltransferase involved in cell wall biosynthesis
MRLLFVLGSGYPPDQIGGMEKTMEELGDRLISMGHELIVLTRRPRSFDSLSWRINYWMNWQHNHLDKKYSYPVFRGLDLLEDLPNQINRWNPDISINTGTDCFQLSEICSNMGLNSITYLQDSSGAQVHWRDKNMMTLRSGIDTQFVAASNYLANIYKEKLGVSSIVIPPLVEIQNYRVDSKRDRALMIGLNKGKGISLIESLVRVCPSIDFDIYPTWGKVPKSSLMNLLLRRNAHIHRGTNKPNQLYSRARILLVPSYDEGWCRAVTEAQQSGIPSLARKVGALPESVGNGGILIDAKKSADDWATILNDIWNDKIRYDRLSMTAYEAGQRPFINPKNILSKWDNLIDTICKNKN